MQSAHALHCPEDDQVRPRSKSIPSATHQADKRLKPRGPAYWQGRPSIAADRFGQAVALKYLLNLLRTVFAPPIFHRRTSKR